MKGILFLLLLLPLFGISQLQQVYIDADEDNGVQGISFINDNQGFVAFEKWIGYTSDGGKTFAKKYISYGNVNYNGFLPVNLTFGFNINGVHAFSATHIIVYGDYGFVPAILVSTDQGNTFKLVYHATMQLSTSNEGFRQLQFVPGTQTGFAIEKDRLLKTSDNGEHWNVLMQNLQSNFSEIVFPTITTGFVRGTAFFKVTNGGAVITPVSSSPGIPTAITFSDQEKGWIIIDGSILSTTDGAATWKKHGLTAQHAAGRLLFYNDTTVYTIGRGGEVYESRDLGKYWEPLARESGSQQLTYPHSSLFLLKPATIFAGGAHGFIEKVDLAHVITRPVASFSFDTSELSVSGKIKFLNLGKPGYVYRWYRNNLLFSSDYNAEFVSSRLSIDTFRLVVVKGIDSSGHEEVIDLRLDKRQCFPSFTFVPDTNTVKFDPDFDVAGAVHTWNFGDDSNESNVLSPTHIYAKVGTYYVSHHVYNPADQCTSTTTAEVTVQRIQNCLSPSFTMVADSFYTNHLVFTASYDKSTELFETGWHTYLWQFGNGEESERPVVGINYESSGNYNVCLSLKNAYTGCVNKICHNVFVFMDTTCKAEFRIQNRAEQITFSGRPAAVSTGKRHTWKFFTGNNKGTVVNSGNSEKLEYSFFQHYYFGGEYFNDRYGGNGSSCDAIQEICIDSLNKKIRHVVYDSISGCSDSTDQSYTVPRQLQVFIRAVPNPNFSQQITFYAYEKWTNGTEVPYSGAWRVIAPGYTHYQGGYTGDNSSMTHTFRYAARHQVAIGARTCGGGGREIYYINVDVVAEPCPVYQPTFSYLPDADNNNQITFNQVIESVNYTLDNNMQWFFGDGDSSTVYSPTHRYAQPGIYVVRLRYTNKNGCFKEHTKTVTIGLKCAILPSFSLARDSASKSTIYLKSLSTADTAIVSYKWKFGNGDTSISKDPVYKYTIAGTYRIVLTAFAYGGCEKSVDTTITITAQDIQPVVVPPVCIVKAAFGVNGTMKVGSSVTFTNRSVTDSGVLGYKWFFGNGDSSSLINPLYTYRSPGTYKVTLRTVKWPGCENSHDTTLIISNDPRCELVASFSTAFAGNEVTLSPNVSGLLPGDKILWSFGDGDSSTAVSVAHIYKNAGTYNVCLNVSRDANCFSMICDTVTIGSIKPESIDIRPNPVNSTLLISLQSMSPAATNVSIYNQQGRVVLRMPYSAVTGLNTISINVSGLSPGVYSVLITGYIGNLSKQFIKL